MKTILKTFILAAIILLSLNTFAQKRAMTIDDLKTWNTVKEKEISPNGNFVSFVIKPHKGDANLFLFNAKKKSQKKFERGYSSKLGFDNNLLVFKIKVEEKLDMEYVHAPVPDEACSQCHDPHAGVLIDSEKALCGACHDVEEKYFLEFGLFRMGIIN